MGKDVKRLHLRQNIQDYMRYKVSDVTVKLYRSDYNMKVGDRSVLIFISAHLAVFVRIM